MVELYKPGQSVEGASYPSYVEFRDRTWIFTGTHLRRREVLLAVVAAAACLIPAQLAAKVHPIVALRYE